MQIVSASRRTDIPAFYSPWLMERLRAGWVRYPNPFNPLRITTVDLRPEHVAALVLWTKDPRPLLSCLEEMQGRGYRTLFHVTLTGLPRILEPAVPPVSAVLEGVRELSRRVGPGRVVWRFDPILLSPMTPQEKILDAFCRIAASLQGAVRQVTVSFARPYRQIPPRLRRAGAEGFAFSDLAGLPENEAVVRIAPLARKMVEAASGAGLAVFSCAERLDLSPFGIFPGACIDAAALRDEFGLDLPRRKDSGQRPECRCIPSVDIGIYGTCPHRCLYCYARGDSLLSRGKRHDPGGVMMLEGGEEDRQPGLF